MKVAVTLDQHYLGTPDGAVWTTSLSPYAFFRRYLAAFDGVVVVARVWPVAEAPPGAKRVDGEGVEVAAMPTYRGPWGYVRTRAAVRQALDEVLDRVGTVILRLPSQLGNALAARARRRGMNWAVELVSDAWDNLAPGAIRSPLRPLYRVLFTRITKRLVAEAPAVSYVTAAALQRRYPAGSTAITLACPCSTLRPEDLAPAPRRWEPGPRTWRLVHVGMLLQLYKAPDVLLRALASPALAECDWRLVIVGDGDYRPWLSGLAEELGIADRVIFRGALPTGQAVIAELDDADLFILPSRQEGLPRAMVEAMSRALPCIGSTIGGIPELLDADAMVPPDDQPALAAAIARALRDPAWMEGQSQRNLARAHDFGAERIEPLRTGFYRRIRAMTEATGP